MSSYLTLCCYEGRCIPLYITFKWKHLSKPHSVPILTKPSWFHSKKYQLLGVADIVVMAKFKWHWIQTYLEGADSCHHCMPATPNSILLIGVFKNLTLFIEFLISAKHRASGIDPQMNTASSTATRSFQVSEDGTCWEMQHGILQRVLEWNLKTQTWFSLAQDLTFIQWQAQCNSRETEVGKEVQKK